MHRGKPSSYFWLCAVALVSAVSGCSTRAFRNEDTGGISLRVIFPAEQCIVESGKLELLCVIPGSVPSVASRIPLRVDGKPRSWEPYQTPILLSRLELAPGWHDVTIGVKHLRIFVLNSTEADRAPRGWPVLKSHPGGNNGWKDCAVCHQVTDEDGRAAVGDPEDSSICFQCHSSVEFELTHLHTEAPFASCEVCHAIHGSSRPSLLIAPVKELCTLCHD